MDRDAVTDASRLSRVRRLFLDTATVIYLVERNPRYFQAVSRIFELLDSGTLLAVTSPITLAECLVHPYRLHDDELAHAFSRVILHGRGTTFVPITQQSAERAAELRAHLRLSLADSLQVATALLSDCDALLTNDRGLRQVDQLRIIVIEDLLTTAEPSIEGP